MSVLCRIPEGLRKSVAIANIVGLLTLFGIWQWVSHCSRGLCTVEGIYFMLGLTFSIAVASALSWKTAAQIGVIAVMFSFGYAIYDGDAAQRSSEYLYYITEPQAVDIMLVGGKPEELPLPEVTDIRSEFILVRSYMVDGIQFYATTFAVLCVIQLFLFVWNIQELHRRTTYCEKVITPFEPVIDVTANSCGD